MKKKKERKWKKKKRNDERIRARRVGDGAEESSALRQLINRMPFYDFPVITIPLPIYWAFHNAPDNFSLLNVIYPHYKDIQCW